MIQTKTPILLIIFNRPDLTEKAMAAIEAARPPVLFVAADGPRPNNEADVELCEATQQICRRVNWPCETLYDISDVNLGCGQRPATAITWAFEHTERLIVLEDDCVPHRSCFRYCDELLAEYADDRRVMHIGCTHFRKPTGNDKCSYRFSKYPHGVCWATWKRAWQHYDYEVRGWPAFRDSSSFRRCCPSRLERTYWTWYFDKAYSDASRHYWDYQWTFACWLNEGLSISPNVNLVSNLGFRPDGTHTTSEAAWANMPTYDIGELVHPQRIQADRRADWWEFVHHYAGESYVRSARPIGRIRSALGRIRAALRG